ncbi:MAG: hypothetical protein ABIJ00_06785 [Candidatus Eisenbacteria bacterium]
MTKGYYTLIVSGVILLLMPTVLLGWNFDYMLFSQPGGIVNSAAVYEGTITSGGVGTFRITLNDTGWPVDPVLRFNHIWTTYFAANWDSAGGQAKWVGQIPGRFYINATSAPIGYNGWCEGSINAKITVRDLNKNQILDAAELAKQHLFDGRLSKLCDYPDGDPAGGEMADKWGWGAVASNYFSFEATPVDTIYNGTNLTLTTMGCVSDVEPTTWGSVKSLYR